MAKDFSVYSGKFICKKCNEEVKSLRLWNETGDATWMCESKHVSRVALIPDKRRKVDFNSE